MNNKITELANLVAAQIPTLFADAQDDINSSINAIMEDAKDGESKPVLRLSISVEWGLNGSAVIVKMPVNVRRRFEQVASLPDPSQPNLPMEGGAE